jgi:ubiquinone/menaquinone biosynthesis C-methylase UbiE
MDEQQSAAVAEAFSRKALVYDAFGQGHPNLERMRRRVREHILGYLRPGDRLLELNAGSGADAAYFAGLGYRVHATDLAPGMLAEMQAKALRPELGGRMSVQGVDFHHLERVPGGLFQHVYSNMGGVNCTVELERIASGVDGLLAPGGYVTWVVMPPTCLWELAQALRGDLHTALRRLGPGGVRARVEGVAFTTWYHPPGRVRQAFGRGYRLLRLRGLSVFTPPADHKEFALRHARLYAGLQALDERLADHPPFNRWGDFYILTLKKT